MDASARNVHLSVVVPCYNEEGVLAELLRRVGAVCRTAAGSSYEIVLVNDGSRDGTWRTMLAHAASDPHLVCVNLSRNYGHQIALTAGLQICTGMRIFILDADLQDPPELLPRMMERMDTGLDVVYGQRRTRVGETWFKRATARVFYRMLGRLADIDIPADAGDFRLMSRRALDVLNAMPERDRFVRGMISWIGFNQEPFVYERAARTSGRSGYPFAKMLKLSVDALTGFSVVPLRLASYLGFISGIAGILLLIDVMISWFHHTNVPGWTSLMVVVLAIGSAQLMVAGVMGEYLGRLYLETKRRPLYVVQDVVRGRAQSPARPVETPVAVAAT